MMRPKNTSRVRVYFIHSRCLHSLEYNERFNVRKEEYCFEGDGDGLFV